MDDNEINRNAAVSLLEGHNVTAVSSFARAELALKESTFDVVLSDLLVPVEQAGGKAHCWDNPNEVKESFHLWEGMESQQIPIGMFLAFLALKYGVKYVAVVTDANHHEHPAARSLDPIKGSMILGMTKVVFLNDALEWLKEETLKPLPGGYDEVYDTCEHVVKGDRIVGFKGMVKSKSWHRSLEYLLGDM